MDRIELRVTRCKFYSKDEPLEGREGYYFRGTDERDAKQKALDKYPNEELTFTVWKRWNENGEQVSIKEEPQI